ncbi:MAG: protein translocase subunit SecD [Clostridia bacterium]|nr:protein translocase subunit SecD [Clostridia bacterium]
MKKILSLLIVIVLIAGWAFSIGGFGAGGNVADRMHLGLDMIGGVSVVLEADTDATGGELKTLMEQVQSVMEKRVNEMGLSEPVITIENENRIRIELPGAQDAQEAIETIGKTAQLNFMTTDENVVITGENVKNAVAGAYKGNQANLMGTFAIQLEFDAAGADLFAEATRKIVNRQINCTMDGYSANQILILLDGDVISDPMVSTVINSTTCEITGRFTESEAANLAALIRGGSLPVTLNEVQTEIVGPTLGMDAAQKSVIAGAIGIGLILILMIAAYRIMGVAADISLLLYILLYLWVFIAFKAVLTLPGIAGFILSIGMAVDSNVIIFSRIREEMGLGKSARVAVQSGFKRALTTIIDSQLTTVIAAVILYTFGTGSVRGFAMTLLIGIVLSVFTAVVVSQLLLQFIAETPALCKKSMFGLKKEIKDTSAEDKNGYPFMSKRKMFYIASVVLLVIGLGIGVVRGFNMGIDFTGGTSLQLNLGQHVDEAELKKYLPDTDIRDNIQYAGENNEKVILKTTQVMDNEERQALCKELQTAFGKTDEFVESAGLIGPSVGSQLKSNALKAILIASVAMLAYIAFRFEWRFGIAAIVALLHDAAMLFAFYGLFHFQMNRPFIAGLLIVIGYSINDTIVIFDRIREGMRQSKRKQEFVIDSSITACISRSIMTSVTTMLAILPLIILCGSQIRAFALPLIAGVLVGTYSSIGVASGVYFDLCRLTKKNKYKGA